MLLRIRWQLSESLQENCLTRPEISDEEGSRLVIILIFATDSRPNSKYSTSSQETEGINNTPTRHAETHMDISEVWMVPFEQNHYFVGRHDQLEAVRCSFTKALKDHYRIAIYGLGGVGKTQFALEYLYRFRVDYRFVFWVSGVDRTTYISDLASIAAKVKFNPSRQNLTSEETAGEILQYLRQIDRWLLVIDNLDDMHVMDKFLPTGTIRGHILITTRRSNLGELPAQTIEVPTLNEDEATQLLLSGVKSESAATDDISEAKKIVKELGYLPLAIEQAAGYIRTSSDGITGFLSVYNSNRKQILNRPGPRSYPTSVAATWQLSFNKIRRENPKALELLNLFAFLNPDEIMVGFLQAGKECHDESIRYLLSEPCVFNCTYWLTSESIPELDAFRKRKPSASTDWFSSLSKTISVRKTECYGGQKLWLYVNMLFQWFDKKIFWSIDDIEVKS